MRRRVLALSLLSSLTACSLIGLGPAPTGTEGTEGTEATVGTQVAPEAYAPPPGLPDLRPVFGLDPNHWAPAFMPAFTQEAARAEVVAALTDFEEVESSPGEVELVTLVPKKPGRPAGVRSLQLSFQKGKLYSASVKFSFKHRYDPAFQLYAVHLARLNFGPIEDGELDSEETITIIGEDSSSIQMPNRDGIELNLNFPRKIQTGRVASPTPAPSYPPARIANEAALAPPEGLPDLRPVLGIDRDHWAPAFMKAYREGAPEQEVLAAMTAFDVVVPPEEGDYATAELTPKDAAAFPGLAKLKLTFRMAEGQSARGLTKASIVLAGEETPELRAYVAKLAELNFGRVEPEEVGEIMTWIGDHGAMAQASMSGEPSIQITFPDF
jgi:hypothetical protein